MHGKRACHNGTLHSIEICRGREHKVRPMVLDVVELY
jgi:hypothetical protein